MLTFWLTTYLLCLVDVFFNRHHTYRYKLCSSSLQRVPVFAWGRFHTGSSQEKRTFIARSFNFTFRCLDDVLSLFILALWFGWSHTSVPLSLKYKLRWIHISLFHTLTYTSRGGQELNFTTKEIISIVPLWTPFICSNIPAAPAYWVHISQFIRYSRACGFYLDFRNRELLQARKLLSQGLSLRTFNSMVDHYGISVSQMTMAMFHLS